jgi:hypothetical protein
MAISVDEMEMAEVTTSGIGVEVMRISSVSFRLSVTD